MDNRELRVGNWVIDLDGCHNQIGSGYDIEGIWKPIPITDKWLIEFGFVRVEMPMYTKYEKIEKVCDAHGLLSPKLFSVNSNCTNFFMNNNWLSTLKHVHQLQNIYHALTGVELIPNK